MALKVERLELRHDHRGRNTHRGCVCHERIGCIRLDLVEHEVWETVARTEIEGMLDVSVSKSSPWHFR
jgi:hypothetical protein